MLTTRAVPASKTHRSFKIPSDPRYLTAIDTRMDGSCYSHRTPDHTRSHYAPPTPPSADASTISRPPREPPPLSSGRRYWGRVRTPRCRSRRAGTAPERGRPRRARRRAPRTAGRSGSGSRPHCRTGTDRDESACPGGGRQAAPAASPGTNAAQRPQTDIQTDRQTQERRRQWRHTTGGEKADRYVWTVR